MRYGIKEGGAEAVRIKNKNSKREWFCKNKIKYREKNKEKF